MKSVFLLLASIAVLALPTCAAAKHGHPGNGLADTTVMIIRHAEKPDHGAGLTPAGEARAQAYVGYFEHFALEGQRMTPNALYAAADSKSSMRPRLTITPLSQALGLAIDERFADKQPGQIAADLRTGAHGDRVLICWHHGEIPELIRQLGGDPVALLHGDKWPADVFGWVVVLRYDHHGRLADARLVHEQLMPDDR
ncbi:MAG TPA: flagellar basal body-associated protein FliL [Dyella sp.]|uniref:flagellar basal body-associated protein FliL n=1 Tax=Dyella sp. TaxID=1869338 RepID=UPI002B544D19|nr:flagellar basal body-associated protein FliL [Dyella sp.]HTV86796.1 flagellar basal body-associated protein FliL [Dyella sp.]